MYLSSIYFKDSLEIQKRLVNQRIFLVVTDLSTIHRIKILIADKVDAIGYSQIVQYPWRMNEWTSGSPWNLDLTIH